MFRLQQSTNLHPHYAFGSLQRQRRRGSTATPHAEAMAPPFLHGPRSSDGGCLIRRWWHLDPAYTPTRSSILTLAPPPRSGGGGGPRSDGEASSIRQRIPAGVYCCWEDEGGVARAAGRRHVLHAGFHLSHVLKMAICV
jgi:hypothetical protein